MEQEGRFKFMFINGTFLVHTLVDQDSSNMRMKFMQPKQGFMKVRGGTGRKRKGRGRKRITYVVSVCACSMMYLHEPLGC